MKNSYFFLLWRQNRYLFAMLLFFVVGQLFFSYKGVETTPFFNYGMYSESCKKRTTYSTISVYQNKERIPLDQLCNAPAFLAYQLDFYQKLVAQDSLDPILTTIQQRFGKESTLTQYLAKHLCNSKEALQIFPQWIEKWLGNKNTSIHQENYNWVNYFPKKVSSTILHE